MAKDALRIAGGRVDTASGGADEELNLRELWRALTRRKWVLALTVLLITGGTYLYVSQLTPRYMAEALVRIQTRDAQVVNIQGVVEELVADAATMESEIESLRSRAFARRLVEDLKLDQDPEFNVALRPEEPSLVGYINPLRYLPEEWGSAVAGLLEREPTAVPFDEEALAEALAPELNSVNNATGTVTSRLQADQIGRSHVISLKFESEDPAKAARIANAAAEAYLVDQIEEKFRAAERATGWLRERIAELRAELSETEGKIVRYRQENRLVNTDERSNPVTLQLTQLNTQLALAQAQRAESEARASQVRSLFNSEGGIDAAAKVLTSPLMVALREEEADLQRRMSELATTFGERHPTMVGLRADAESVREKMQDEVRRILTDLENEVVVARARERELQNSLGGLEGQSATLDMAEVELNNLNREAQANRELLGTFITRFREIVEQQGLQKPDAQIVSAADAPRFPSYPRKVAFLAVAFGASMLLGVLLVFVIERWDSGFGFRSAEEIQSVAGLRSLALVPDLARREAQGIPAEEYVLQRPSSAFAEALQRVRTNLFLANGNRPPRSVLITSSIPLEGKTTIAASLARQSARSGMKVLLIDADLRRPRLHEIIGVANQNGLSEVLTGLVSRAEAIRRDERSSGLDFMPAGAGATSPPDLFRSQVTRRLIEELEAVYDLVIIDSPPVAAVSDSFTLSGLIAKTIYIVRWERTPRNVALSGLAQLAEAGADIAGVVLSRVNVRKHARYGYADSGYYSGYYRKYYVN
ncbi:MAG TPA: polysaccharide biosynthesis tyrosine autokinase [Geminicoccaceae bacterium]|nr:polysaccharide biosynthesis tyrosine autokinase [Geminicoccaceae bacterium]